MTENIPLAPAEPEHDAFIDRYPNRHHPVLIKYGVDPEISDRAEAYNGRVIALAERGGDIDGDVFARSVEAIFLEEFGGMLTLRASTPDTRPGDPNVRHVDLGALHQVSIANGIGHIIERFRAREVAAMMGFTVDGRGAIRLMVGGDAPQHVLRAGAAHLYGHGVRLLTGQAEEPEDTAAEVRVQPFVHTRDRLEQQAAVGRALSEAQDRYREGEVEMVLGITVDDLGHAYPFVGGSIDGRLQRHVIDALVALLEEGGERQFDH